MTKNPIDDEPEDTGRCPLCPIIPNAETVAAMEAAERGQFVGEYTTVDELLADLDQREEE